MTQLNRKDYTVTKWLREELEGCESVLDLGCGRSSLLQYVPDIKYSVGVEYWQADIDESQAHQIHSKYIKADITTLQIPDNEYDAVLLFDVLEHIEKKAGRKLLLDMIRWSKKKVVIGVPNGDMPQDEDPYGEGNDKQKHISEWTTQELEELGFFVRGFGGWKPLRGDGGNIIPTKTKLEHYILSGLSLLSEPIVKVAPDYAFHLFAVLDKPGV